MELSPNIEVVKYEDKEIYLLGTAHVSKKSVEEVTQSVADLSPDTICVELCEARLKSIEDRDNWKKMDIFKVIKEKKTVFLFAQLMMSSFYRKLGKDLEVTPGAEMIQGVTEARGNDIELILADRNIEITLRRVWGGLGFFQKLMFASSLLSSFVFPSEEKIDDETIEKLKESDHLENAMDEFAQAYPGVRERLIFERDIYLAEKIKASKGKKILAVVGAGHVPGIKQRLFEENSLEPITEIPPKSIVPTLIGWSIPLLIIALIAWGYVDGGAQKGTEMVMIWVIMNSVLSALGAAIALAHPLTILTAAISAPITSLIPVIGVGYVAGPVQAFLKKPTVEDLEEVPNAVETVKGFWHNPLTRVLLVIMLTSIGSVIGTFGAPTLMAKVMVDKPEIQAAITVADTLHIGSETTISWEKERKAALTLMKGDSIISELSKDISGTSFTWQPTESGKFSLRLIEGSDTLLSKEFTILEKAAK